MDTHTYVHYEPTKPSVTMKMERNSRSINWEVAVSNCESPEQAERLLTEAIARAEKLVQERTPNA